MIDIITKVCYYTFKLKPIKTMKAFVINIKINPAQEVRSATRENRLNGRKVCTMSHANKKKFARHPKHKGGDRF